MGKRSAIENYIYGQYVRCATKRGYSFELDIDVFFAIADAPCVYCKAENTNTARRARKNGDLVRVYNGVDRVNSDLPYVVGNCVSCCKACNAAKSARSHADFVNSEWLKNRIAEIAAK